jgi:hypothetical protein
MAGAAIRNDWRLWAVPPAQLPRVLAVEPSAAGRLHVDRLDRNARVVAPSAAPGDAPLLCTELSPQALQWVKGGGRALVWQVLADAGFTRTLPFWREAIHVFEPDALWERVPEPGYADMRFFSIANDVAFDLAALRDVLGPEAHCRPVWRRFDARTLAWAEYLVDVQYGAGRMWISSLRFEGGLGRQPEGFDANPIGAWLLASLLHGASQG